jgi:hypothetical protein
MSSFTAIEMPRSTAFSGILVSAGIGIDQPFALFGSSVLALVWLSPTPTMAISEMPTGESQRPMEA